MYRGFLIDLDGTVYHGGKAIPTAILFIKRLDEKGLPFLLLTNNSSRTPEQLVEHLQGMGLPFVQRKHIYTSSMAAADWIKEEAGTANARVFVIGETGLKAAITAEGLRLDETSPDYVAVGIDRDISYQKMRLAVNAILAGAKFVATNADRLMPEEDGFAPGNGALCAAISYATNQTPVWIGKPSPIIVARALAVLGQNKEDVLLIGDNLETDVLAGVEAGIDTAMVLTGVSKAADLQNVSFAPTYVLDALQDWVIDH